MQIKINGLTKVYPNGNIALEDINLEIHEGLFGLLGPNGAGKSTLMQILVTLMLPSSGTVEIDGYDLFKNRGEIRSLIGYLPQDFSTFPKIKTWEFLDYNARLAGISDSKKRQHRVNELLESVGLSAARDRFANKLSGGMKRRVGIAQALIGDPKILIVDEPTTGLDPEERIRFRNVLTDMSQEGRIIILSTHIVADISSTCNDMALLKNGQLAYSGSPSALIEKARPHTWIIETDASRLEELKQKYIVISTVPSTDGWLVEFVADSVKEKNARLTEPNLEHAYVSFMELEQHEAI